MSTEILVTTGPESSGKTTLASQLADYWKTPLVSEASRVMASTMAEKLASLQPPPSQPLDFNNMLGAIKSAAVEAAREAAHVPADGGPRLLPQAWHRAPRSEAAGASLQAVRG